MYALIYAGTDKIHSITGNVPGPNNYDLSKLDVIEIPEQDTKHLYREDADGIIEMIGAVSDLRRYTQEEVSKTPSAARAALKERGPVENEKSVANLRERVALIEQIIGV